MVLLQDFLRVCKDYLRRKNIDSPEISAEVIFSHCLNISRLDVLLSREKISLKEVKRILQLIVRRGKGEPLAYLVGKKEFYGRDFFVNKNVLIPRGCTETIIDLCKHFYGNLDEVVFLDIGTGSGNLGITLVCEFENFFGTLIDVSFEALEVAKKNVLFYRVQDRVSLVNTDLLGCFKDKKVDLIVSNPPYLSRKLLNEASNEVKDFEPHIALFGGDDGLDIPKRIFSQAVYVIRDGGRIFMELDSSQLDYMKDFLTSSQWWCDIEIYKDLEGHNRVIGARLV